MATVAIGRRPSALATQSTDRALLRAFLDQDRLYAAYREGRKVLIVGNGGSAATASHMACDLAKNVFGQFPGDAAPSGRFKVLALTDNIPLITAWANDAGYDRVFLEQVRTFTDPGDVLVAISGSGNSPNVVEAVKLARRLGAETIGILVFSGGKLKDLVDRAVIVTSDGHPDVCATGNLATPAEQQRILQQTLAANPGLSVQVHTIYVGRSNEA